MRRFYSDFAAAYGTCWLVTVVGAGLLQAQIETGLPGFIGYPAVSIAYAAWRARMPYLS